LAEVRAVIFDVDGTIVDTERDGHRPAFNEAFARHGLPYHWDVADYGRLLEYTGGKRRIERFLAERGHPGDHADLAASLHATKTRLFREWLTSGTLQARPGVDSFLSRLSGAGVRLAVCTTGTREWVMPLLERVFGADRFEDIVTGNDVDELKPAPDAYVEVLGRLALDAREAVAIEDSRNGLVAAVRAGLGCWIVRNAYTTTQVFDGALGTFDNFGLGGLTSDHVLQQAGR